MLPAPKPIRNIATKAPIEPGAIRTPTTPKRATNVVSNKNTRGLIQFKTIAPNKRAIVSPAKNTLIPTTAASKVKSNLAIRIFAMFVFIATSVPTIRKIESAINATNLFYNKPKQEANDAGLRSDFDSSIGVIDSQTAPNIEVIP
jgi:hypothetical protein